MSYQLPVINNQEKISNEINKKDHFKKKMSQTVIMDSAIIDKSLKISWTEYLYLKFKKIWSKNEKFEVLTNYEKSEKLKKKVLNEDAIYKCFFEMEKLKTIIFDEKHLEIFNYCRLDINHLFEKNSFFMNEKEMNIYLEKYGEYSEIKFIDSRLKEMLLNTIKAISNTKLYK